MFYRFPWDFYINNHVIYKYRKSYFFLSNPSAFNILFATA